MFYSLPKVELLSLSPPSILAPNSPVQSLVVLKNGIGHAHANVEYEWSYPIAATAAMYSPLLATNETADLGPPRTPFLFLPHCPLLVLKLQKHRRFPFVTGPQSGHVSL